LQPGEDPSNVPDPRQVPKRPAAATLVGLLALAIGVYSVVDGAIGLADGGDDSSLAGAAFEIGFGVLAIGICNGALRMRRWAWAAFMTLAVIGMTHQLLRNFFYDHPNYLSLAFTTFAVFALTPLDVQIAFAVRPPRNVILEPTRNPIDNL